MCSLLPLLLMSAAIWWLYLLAYGAFPLSLASDLYHLFVGIVATTSNYWLFLLLVPIACQLPDFFWRQVRRYVVLTQAAVVAGCAGHDNCA